MMSAYVAEQPAVEQTPERIDEVIGHRHFDLSRRWLPVRLSGADRVACLSSAEKVKLTGTKPEQKKYFHHTMYPGGASWTKISEMFAKHPERVVEKAVKGMVPRNRLGRAMVKKLKVYAGPEHPHQAQKPEAWTIEA